MNQNIHRIFLLTYILMVSLLSFTFFSGCITADQRIGLNSDHVHQIDTPSSIPAGKSDNPNPPALLQDGPIKLSVEEAVLFALKRNQDLKVKQLSPVIAGTFEQIEKGVFDAEFFSDFSYSKERVTETSRSTGSQYDTKAENYEITAGLRQQLPSGTDIEIKVEQDRSISDRTPEQQTARVGLSLTQSLLQGFGPKINLAGVRQAELDTLASIYELRAYTESVLAEVEMTYWQYVLAQKEIEIYEQSLHVAELQSNEIEQRIDVGELSLNEAAAARTEVARRKQDLIDAQSSLEDRRLRLVKLLNLSSSGRRDVQIVPLSQPGIEAEPVTDVDERIRLAEKIRPDLCEARLRLQKNELEIIVTRNGLLPRLELFFVLGRSGFSDTILESFKQIDGPTYDYTGGIRFSHYLGNKAAKAKNIAAHATRQQAEEAIENLRQIAGLDVLLGVNELERLRKQISASAETRAFQEQTAHAEKERFDVGSSTSLQLAQAQRDLLQSKIAEIEAVINYRIQLVKLYLAEGSLLDRRGIQLEKQDGLE